MDTNDVLRKHESTNGLQPEMVIANWLKAICLLNLNYKLLTACENEHRLRQKSSKKVIKKLGQCSVSQIFKLKRLFQKELEVLLLDVNGCMKESALDKLKDYEKLAAHTLILNKLNNQAQTRLHLTREFTS